MDECVKAGDVCPSALHCLKQGDGSYACACDAKGFKVVGKGDARNCAGKSFSYVMDDHAFYLFWYYIYRIKYRSVIERKPLVLVF